MYRITGFVQNNLKIVGYKLLDEEGNETNVGNNTLIEKVRNNEVYDTHLVKLSDGREVVAGIKYNRLDCIRLNKLHVVERKIENGEVIGYRVAKENGDRVLISKIKAWSLAADGCIDNLIAKVVDVDGVYSKVILDKETADELVGGNET